MEERFYSYRRYLEDTYGEPVFRVGVDGGFGCPNRTGRGGGGCSYCDEQGSRAGYIDTETDLEGQVLKGIEFLRRRYQATGFILYFQAFSSTFAPTARLKDVYDKGLGLADFRELVVSTRPDCLDEPRADLLASYRTTSRDVWVELGLQSGFNDTLCRIGRGHDVEDFERAAALVKERGMKLGVHLIPGLPGDGWERQRETVSRLATMGIDGIKFHNPHVPQGTRMYEEFLRGEFTLPGPERYTEYLIRSLELLDPRTVVLRLTFDPPKERCGYPPDFWKKDRLYAIMADEMEARDTYQGRLFSPEAS